MLRGPKVRDRWIEYGIADCLTQMRHERGLTQPALGLRVGVSKNMIYYYETSAFFPSRLLQLRDWVEGAGGRLELAIVRKSGERREF